jgi:hypothetical protein
MLTADDIFGGTAAAPIEVTPPWSSTPIRLRYPTFSEWYELICEHKKLDAAGGQKDPPAELLAKAVAYCVAGPDGKRFLTVDQVLERRPSEVVWLYQKVCDTVIRDDDELVGEVAKK